jgi:hypothetical protein
MVVDTRLLSAQGVANQLGVCAIRTDRTCLCHETSARAATNGLTSTAQRSQQILDRNHTEDSDLPVQICRGHIGKQRFQRGFSNTA